MFSKISQRKTNIIWYYMQNLKSNINECIYKTKTDSHTENKLVFTSGEGTVRRGKLVV